MREIFPSAIEDAAPAMYDPVVRTPLVRLVLPRSDTERDPDTGSFHKLETLQRVGLEIGNLRDAFASFALR